MYSACRRCQRGGPPVLPALRCGGAAALKVARNGAICSRNSKPPVPSITSFLPQTRLPITLVEMARRQHLTLSLLLIVFLFLSISYFFTSAPAAARDRAASLVGAAVPNKQQPAQASTDDQQHNLNHNDATQPANVAAPSATPGFSIDLGSLPSLEGDSIAPKLENATLK